MWITRRRFLQTGVASLAVARSSTSATKVASASAKRDKPHILLLMADQFRGDCLAADGHPCVQTPNLDRIAGEGVRFEHAYSCTPTCTPARSVLLSGLGPWRNGMLGYGRVAEKYPIEMPQALRDAGYFTCGIGKMHWHPQRNLHGFHQVLLDESGRAELPDFRSDYRSWFACQAPTLNPDATGIGWNDYRSSEYALPEELHPTRWMGDTAVRFLDSYEKTEPFFLKVSFARPHSPYDPPKRFMKKYEDTDIPPAAVGEWAAKYAPRSDDSFNIWHGDMGPEQVRRSRQGYYGSISFIDEQIGRILDTLDDRGWLDETLIVFTADHGDMTGDHNLWRKSYAYESSARIPMLMRWPKGLVSAKRGQVSPAPVELRDVLPTFMELAGVPGAEQLDGKSMLAPARGETTGWREFIDLEHDICYSPDNHWSALTDGRWKYIFHAKSGEEQLFNLEKDPKELKDLASEAASQDSLKLWRERLVAHLSERGGAFVKDGRLALRPGSTLYSPNYPGCSCHPKKT